MRELTNLGPPAGAAGPVGADQRLAELARILHLEWCDACGTYRDLGHVDQTAPQNALEEQQYPTIG